MCALQNHVMHALQSTGKILSPSHLVKNLRCISRNFRNFRQEDAHEYMINLLESMHKCCLPSGVPSESPSAYERSLVYKIFGGRLRSQVKCMQCSYCSNTFDPFLDLSLEIAKADSLHKALKHFTGLEQLDGGERQYQCQRCKQKVRAYKQLTINKAPFVLTIHLKRFDSHIAGQKIDRKVEFEPRIDLKPFVSDPNEGDLKYTLYGVLVHAGWNTHSGHYYCFVRTSSGMWHSLDDNQVHQVSEKTVLSQKAYMLFYVRDRSLIVKRSVDGVQKDSLSKCGPGNRANCEIVSGTKGANQNGGAGTKISTSICSMVNLKKDPTISCQPSSMIKIQFSQSSQEAASSVRNGGNENLDEAPKSANKNVSCANQSSNLQLNGNVSSKGLGHCLKESVAANDNTDQKVADDSSKQDQPKDNPIVIPSHKKDTSFEPENDSNCLDVKVKSNYLHAGSKNSAFPEPTSEVLAKTLVMEPDICKSDAAANGIFQNYDASHQGKLKAKLKENLSVSAPTNGFVQNSTSNLSAAKYQAISSEVRSCNLQNQNGGQGLLKVEKPELIKLSNKKNIPNGLLKELAAESVPETSIRTCHEMGTKLKKLPEILLKSKYFGRKQLFMSSLNLAKKKKLKRTKRRCLGSKHLMKSGLSDHLRVSDQGTSTSEATNSISVNSSKHPHCESLQFRLITDSNVQTVENGNQSNGNSTSDQLLDETKRKIGVTLGTSEQPKICLNHAPDQCKSSKTDSHDKGTHQHELVSLLTRGLAETTVARWDDIELPMTENLHRVESSVKKSIGYVLDEWDEEYDRGKRKKVKNGKESFDGANPFQDVASMKARKKMKLKVDQTRVGNQPLRIL
ncbi:ubiquitin carboxyl-terminal hydrolase 23-like [Ananas comosus]|uniref:Ubiquitin carboxyl-terminal hydrolase 23-like n=1 Tax=Ananas comosus TaxID=4615 RepID=A0A6P5GRM5_ANACO|nr:ubiquitin carboxyl-terminal hydrolase 23-like [Ananas comosus]